MADGVVIQHQTVLKRVDKRIFSADDIYFDGDEIGCDGLFISKLLWAAMGSPETITLTVVPGDQLNKEDSNV